MRGLAVLSLCLIHCTLLTPWTKLLPLKLKPAECSLFQKEVKYLGQVISEKGISTDPGKMDAIRNWPTPQCRREVLQFLGLANFTADALDFASISRPLQCLTEKNVRFNRTLLDMLVTMTFTVNFFSEKVLEWTKEIEVLSTFAVSQPHAAYACYTHGKWTFLCRTIPNISELLCPPSDTGFSMP